MRKIVAALLMGSVSMAAVSASAAEAEQAWIAKSNSYTQKLLDIDMKHSPEQGSGEGLAKFDKLIGDPRMSDDLAERKEFEAALAKIKTAGAKETDPAVKQDLAILDK